MSSTNPVDAAIRRSSRKVTSIGCFTRAALSAHPAIVTVVTGAGLPGAPAQAAKPREIAAEATDLSGSIEWLVLGEAVCKRP